jgi:hypothetical protein
MLDSTEAILSSGLGDHVIRDIDLTNLFDGTPARRYGLVNKALKAKELVQLRRGFYVATPRHQPPKFSQYYLANHMEPHSFVTAESALSFHGWIPERVTETLSLAPFGRNKQFDTPYGRFIYRTMPIPPAQFLMGVSHIETEANAFWIATPLRALIDYIQWHKLDKVDLDFLQHSLRIEPEQLYSIKLADIEQVRDVYKAPRIKRFLKILQREITHASSHH